MNLAWRQDPTPSQLSLIIQSPHNRETTSQHTPAPTVYIPLQHISSSRPPCPKSAIDFTRLSQCISRINALNINIILASQPQYILVYSPRTFNAPNLDTNFANSKNQMRDEKFKFALDLIQYNIDKIMCVAVIQWRSTLKVNLFSVVICASEFVRFCTYHLIFYTGCLQTILEWNSFIHIVPS